MNHGQVSMTVIVDGLAPTVVPRLGYSVQMVKTMTSLLFTCRWFPSPVSLSADPGVDLPTLGTGQFHSLGCGTANHRPI